MEENNFGYDNTNLTDADIVKRIKSAVKIDIEKRHYSRNNVFFSAI